MSVMIYGHSDDLIEVDGDVTAEFAASLEDDNLLFFSDGTVICADYMKDGFWRLFVLTKGSAENRKVEGMDLDDDYSDRVWLDGDIQWVGFGTEWTRK